MRDGGGEVEGEEGENGEDGGEALHCCGNVDDVVDVGILVADRRSSVVRRCRNRVIHGDEHGETGNAYIVAGVRRMREPGGE